MRCCAVPGTCTGKPGWKILGKFWPWEEARFGADYFSAFATAYGLESDGNRILRERLNARSWNKNSAPSPPAVHCCWYDWSFNFFHMADVCWSRTNRFEPALRSSHFLRQKPIIRVILSILRVVTVGVRNLMRQSNRSSYWFINTICWLMGYSVRYFHTYGWASDQTPWLGWGCEPGWSQRTWVLISHSKYVLIFSLFV